MPDLPQTSLPTPHDSRLDGERSVFQKQRGHGYPGEWSFPCSSLRWCALWSELVFKDTCHSTGSGVRHTRGKRGTYCANPQAPCPLTWLRKLHTHSPHPHPHTRACAHTHAQADTHAYTFTHTLACKYTHSCMPSQRHAHTLVYTLTCTHSHPHMRTPDSLETPRGVATHFRTVLFFQTAECANVLICFRRMFEPWKSIGE